MEHPESGEARNAEVHGGGQLSATLGPLRERTDLLAVVAHELRQPLAAAMAATDFVAELLDGGADAPLVREYLELARRGMRHSLRMTHDLVTLGQVGSGTLRLRHAPVDAAALLAEARALLALPARAKRVDVRVVVGRPLPPLVADSDRLLQVLINLCGNALKFTPAGGRVTMSARADATADAMWVRVAVRDTGPGVPAADLRRIFEPYWHAGGASTGAGLGLAVAQWLIEAHGGRIAAHPAFGGGLTVAFTIPCNRLDSGVRDERPRPADGGAPKA